MVKRVMRSVLVLLLVVTSRAPAAGQDGPPVLESASRRLIEATLTVRVCHDSPPDQDAGAAAEPAAPQGKRQSVTVCTGVLVAPCLIVAPAFDRPAAQIRITVPGGQQEDARLRIVDEYSGLTLLETASPLATPVALAATLPAVGSWVMSAAGWGTEQPAVSVGILGAGERTLAGTSYPPLLQCDLRTAGTSSGAAVVNGQGQLVGIVVAIDAQPGHRGWTYAVPVTHVRRLLAENAARRDVPEAVTLKRRRPVIGMVLDGREDRVAVSRVLPDSPAERAGIRVGDRVITADGVRIRSVYQAVRPLLYKQPGDRMVFVLEREGRELDAEVHLAGGSELPVTPLPAAGPYLRPSVDLQRIGEAIYAAEDAGQLREVVSPDGGNAPADQPEATTAEKIQLLERALERYRQAIAYLQDRLQQGEQQRRQTEEQIRSLQQQLEELQQQRP